MNTAAAAMPLDADTAARVSRHLARAVEAILHTGHALHFGETERAAELNREANREAQAAQVLLVASGVARPDLPPPATPIGLDQLDTPDTRRLLALLEEAQAVAERVDAARGRALDIDFPLQPGESRGTDLAESLSELALRVRVEVEGPTDRRQEGRRG